ncbi:aldo/keto reductase [Castellaniella sp. S9]|uniref:aldo/keto reductase n=1 Tax=Castellaniella sp. S9 TaxID=2993652 RepID=UPI0022B4256C|nr:aldo/keto reductase [Castellaniella sp. S9]
MPTTRKLGRTDLEIQPLVFGANVLGWTMDEATSFRVLDAYVDGGFTAIDTADSYSRWVPGNDSESEKIIGRWLHARGNRDRVLVLTKVGSDMGQGKRDLSSAWIEQAVEGSLRRLQTDYIDLYQSHWPDPTVSHEETLRAYDRLIQAGKVRHIGCSNFDAALLAQAQSVAEDLGLARYETVQNELNLYSRSAYEGPVQDFVVKNGLSALSYFSLASGFLTGKYRSVADLAGRPRGTWLEKYFDDRGLRILAALDEVAGARGVQQAEVAIAWINAQPGVAAAIASATSLEQLDVLMRAARLRLTDAELARLNEAGRA